MMQLERNIFLQSRKQFGFKSGNKKGNGSEFYSFYCGKNCLMLPFFECLLNGIFSNDCEVYTVYIAENEIKWKDLISIIMSCVFYLIIWLLLVLPVSNR